MFTALIENFKDLMYFTHTRSGSSKQLLVICAENLPPHLNTPHHISSQTEPYFWGPVSVTLDGEGRLYVTEANRHRIQIYQKK